MEATSPAGAIALSSVAAGLRVNSSLEKEALASRDSAEVHGGSLAEADDTASGKVAMNVII